jgi:probable phosphoglycerate mutase
MTPSVGDAQGDVTRVLAVRHGETAWNVENRIQGQLDVPLNELGRWQAQRLAFAMEGETVDAIYTSDLRRTVETAVPTGRACSVGWVTDPGLRERGFGVFEGLTFTEIEQRWPEQSARWRRRDPTFGAEGGETLSEFYARSVACVSRLAAAHWGQSIMIVTHGGVLDCLYRAASRVALDAPRSWQIGNASINRLLFTPQGFTLVGWSDDHHLEDAALDEEADGGGALRARRA